MQLTDAEIREIIRRRKLEKIRRRRRRRRDLLLLLIILAVVILIIVKVTGRSAAPDAGKDTADVPAEPVANRGVIFIDPGHGGMDSGSDDDNERYEKDDTLKLSLAVKKALEKKGFTVEMSRTEDELVDRTVRGEKANSCGAQLFISIHRNKANGDGHGVEGFIPKTNDHGSRLLGESIMHYLGRAGFTERSIRAGTLNDPKDDYEEIAATTMPSVLIEVGFLSSPSDNAMFDNNMGRNARAIATAIDYTFISLYEPDKTAEFEARQAELDNLTDTAVSSLVQAVDEASSAISAMKWVDGGKDGQATGIDPEA